MKSNALLRYAQSHNKALVAYLIATIVFAVYQFNPGISTSIGISLIFIIPGILSLSGVLGAILGCLFSFVLIGLFCTVIVLVYYLLQVRNFISSAVMGFAMSYAFIIWLAVFVKLTLPMKLFCMVIVYMLFFITALISSKRKWHIIISVAVGCILILPSLYFAPYVTTQLENKQYEATNTNTFNTAVKDLNFTAYYPTYTYSILPTSPPRLNGYDKQPYTNETVSFLLGKAQVRESAILANQDKVMNFTNNCDINAILGSMETDSSITDFELQASLDNFKKCNMIQHTSTGKKVYFASNDQWTYFYTRIKDTNVILSFDDINTQKYDSSQLSEILKIIDSLQPVNKTELQKGNTTGVGFE